ncbi:hypothetical protein LGK95_02730 [Clostridium algoriphilum]|uniref:hypothetical protein n=1 Tax=Clostridium algoriphilum TaxID=198347 RepID=UPI001CF580B1|nr:hypothetical protein [Clostridium algoriphilum]MCB2292455.1 hypothetical protein [Clostridium algoriphilum]
MVIDNKKKFDTDKDELVWTKIISTYPYAKDNNRSTHLVKYYKTQFNEEYYIFKYIKTNNNGYIVDDFDEFHWSEIIQQIDISDKCYIYSQLCNDINCIKSVTSGRIIKRDIQEYTRIYELKHHQ